MTNAGMTNDEQVLKPVHSSFLHFVIRHSSLGFIRHFGIRHFDIPFS